MKARRTLKVCPIAVHEAIKASPAWSKYPVCGYQEGVNGKRLELRNCTCGSTMAKVVEKAAA